MAILISRIASFDKFAARVVGPLGPHDVIRIVQQFQGPMNQKWFSSLSTHLPSAEPKESPSVGDTDDTYVDWSLLDWENMSMFPESFDTELEAMPPQPA